MQIGHTSSRPFAKPTGLSVDRMAPPQDSGSRGRPSSSKCGIWGSRRKQLNRVPALSSYRYRARGSFAVRPSTSDRRQPSIGKTYETKVPKTSDEFYRSESNMYWFTGLMV